MKPPSRIYDLSQPFFSNRPQYPNRVPRPVQVRLHYMLAVQGVNKEIVFPEAVMDRRERLFVAMPIKRQGCSGAWARAMLREA